MDLKFNRRTRFPIHGQAGIDASKNTTNRRTRFPGGTDIEKIHLLQKDNKQDESSSQTGRAASLSLRFPIKVDPSDIASEKLTQEKHTQVISNRISQDDQLPPVRVESPWKSYIFLRHLERGGQVAVAYTRKLPVHMVVVRELVSDNFIELRKCQHENLLSIMEVYRFQGVFFVITDYTAATLKQVIAIPLTIEELHVSATCRQVFEGMQHLSRFGISHRKLDSSRVLFSSDGCVKIAHFEECRTTKSAEARSLGFIAIEMMQNGIPPEEDGKLVLKHPDRWSPEASNFLEVTAWGTLKEIQKHRFLTHVSPTVMIPFIHYAAWDTIESLNL